MSPPEQEGQKKNFIQCRIGLKFDSDVQLQECCRSRKAELRKRNPPISNTFLNRTQIDEGLTAFYSAFRASKASMT